MTTVAGTEAPIQTSALELLDVVAPYEETDDPETKTHIVNPPMNLHIWREGMTAQDVVNIARMLKIEVQALCGYKWVPKHNPEKFDACEKCMTIAGHLMSGRGE